MYVNTLFATMRHSQPTYTFIIDSQGRKHLGIVQAIERESGDGRSFNVRMTLRNGQSVTVFVRTVD